MTTTVRHLLSNKPRVVYSTRPEASVYEALVQMAQHDIGALVVLDEGKKLAGIFSERDYARKVILQGKSSNKVPVESIMTCDVITVRPEQTAAECMALMDQKHIRHLPVIENGEVAGMISIRDVLYAVIKEQENALNRLEQDVLGTELLES